MFQFRVKGVKETKVALRKELVTLKALAAEGMKDGADAIALEALDQLEQKALDPGDFIGKSVDTEVAVQGSTITAKVTVPAETAYGVEMGDKAGFLFIASENKGNEALKITAAKLEGRYGK